ncbi:MAG TPA: CDGSH iron-sulfur domain-containing protein [Bacteroidota bacterium]|jgi:CDGSH-type Zn-finger protein|nr:CDGSH iron-sulfur domain-containing protein [Bacteroidota bacterium]
MPTKIIVKTNGSIKIEGDFELFDEQGNKFDLAGRTKISLCRCGLSQDQPFCDHAHRAIEQPRPRITARALPPPVPKE